MKELKFISPFKKLCITIGNLPTAYIESMSYYEGLTFLVNYLANNVIPAVNNNSEVVKELQDQFVILKNYVDNYFDNLDVQEEINNKLDEMADSGQLTDIIAQYLGLAGMIAFDTVADMKLAENLVNGSKCRTLGYHSVNDGGGAYYKIRQVTNDDVIDESTIIALYDNLLIAELIIDKVNVKQFGAYGDGIHNDYTVLNRAITYCLNNNKTLYSSSGYTYLVESPLIIDNINVDFNYSTIKTTSAIDIIKIDTQDLFGSIKNLTINCNDIATNGIHIIRGRKKLIENVIINNVKNNGIKYDDGYEITMNQIHITGTDDSTTSVGLNLQKGDSNISKIIIIDCYTAIINKAKNFFSDIHAWIKSQALVVGSKFIDVTNGSFSGNNIYGDTYHYMFYTSSNYSPYIQITNGFFYYNKTNVMTDAVMGANIPYIHYNGDDNVSGIHTNHIIFENCEISGQIYNSEKVKLTNETYYMGILTNLIHYNVNLNVNISLSNINALLTTSTNKCYRLTHELNQIDYVGSIDTSQLSERTITLGSTPYLMGPYQAINTFCTYGANEWTQTGLLYCYMNNSGSIQVNIPDAVTGTIFIKIHMVYGGMKE